MRDKSRGRPPKGDIKIAQGQWESKSVLEAIKEEIALLIGQDWQPTSFFTGTKLNRKYRTWGRRARALKVLQDLERTGKIESKRDPNFNEWYWRLTQIPS